ncbi:MAG: TonB-dependent receptor [Colwellia sp.]|nr:TonB-dependent receptor [Colwellia sp.]
MNFKTSSLALAVFAAISSTSVVAEEATIEKIDEIEVITVSGIRGSLVRSLFDKRSAESVVDGISAEDIGKFPDQNVAESLQRITGVTIDRGDSGEGQKISIRGFGPNFNNVLFNGRTMPSDNDQRGFSFDLIASELISGADVHKTLRADTLEGGLGGTVNVKTAKPLDYDGFKGAASVKGVYDTLAKSTNPFFSALVSQNFDNDFGVLASFAYQQRDSRLDKAKITNYKTVSGKTFTGPQGSDTLSASSHLRPWGAQQIVERSDRERIGATLVGQWQAADNVLVTADALYSELTSIKNNKTLSNGYTKGNMYNAKFDEFGTVISFDRPAGLEYVSPGVYKQYENGNRLDRGQTNAILANARNRVSTTTMVGFNIDWQVTDNFTAIIDLQSSKSTASSKNNPLQSVSTYSLTDVHFENTGNSFSWTNDSAFNSNASGYKAGNLYYFSPASKDDITEARLDTEWETEDFGYLTSVKSGLYYSDRQKNKSLTQSRWATAAKVFTNFPIPASQFSTTDLNFLQDHDKGGFANTWLDWDTAALFDYFNSPAALESASFIGDQIINNYENGGTDYTSLEEAQVAADAAVAAKIDSINANIASGPTEGDFGLYNKIADARADRKWQVNEETFAAYVEANLAGDAWSANLGLRYVKTNTSSISAGQEFIGTHRITPNSTALNLKLVEGDKENILSEGSYSKLLPSLNVKYNINDDLVARFAYSKSLTRPPLSDLTAASKIIVPFFFDEEDGFEGQIIGKNSDLKPFTSVNIDLALEWYYAPESYVGGTYFTKSLTDWITTETENVTLRDPIQNVDRVFQKTSPFNAESAKVSGLELALLHNFDSGFGVQANYTMLDTTGAADTTSESRVNLHGLSDSSYNVIGFYENGPIQVRIAYNWREGYTTCNYCIDTKGVNGAKSIDDYGQIDASASYDLTEDISIFADVINLTDEDPYEYTIRKSNILSIADTGTRYSIGVRAKF